MRDLNILLFINFIFYELYNLWNVQRRIKILVFASQGTEKMQKEMEANLKIALWCLWLGVYSLSILVLCSLISSWFLIP